MPTDPKDNKTVNSSRELFKQRRAMIEWAKQEKADIESGAKKPPATSLENFMADRDKPLKTALARETDRSYPRAGEEFNQVVDREAHLGTTGSNPLPPRTVKMPTNKKTAMQEFWARSAKQTERLSQTRTETRLDDPFPENGEMRPGVAERTRVHHLQSRVLARRPAWRSTSSAPATDLGEAVPGAAKAQGLRARAEARAIRQKRSETRKAAGKGVAGSAPRITETFDDKHDLTQIPGGWGKLRPGDL